MASFHGIEICAIIAVAFALSMQTVLGNIYIYMWESVHIYIISSYRMQINYMVVQVMT